jgi:hypothetical protein
MFFFGLFSFLTGQSINYEYIWVYNKSDIRMSDKKVLIGFSIVSIFTLGIGFYKALKPKE